MTATEGDEIRARTREDGGFHSGMLQNPSDPEATFRKKAGKVCRGFAANVVESVGERGSAIVDYQCGENVTSDSQFLRNSIKNLLKQVAGRIVVADGAYGGNRAASCALHNEASSEENRDMAASKNIRLVTTGINGGRVNDILANFEFSEDGTQALKCPAGHESKSCCYLKKAGRG